MDNKIARKMILTGTNQKVAINLFQKKRIFFIVAKLRAGLAN
jgi:hypothetical protein